VTLQDGASKVLGVKSTAPLRPASRDLENLLRIVEILEFDYGFKSLVYTWLILVYTDQEFVHTMSAHGEIQYCSMKLLSTNSVVFNTAIVFGALNN
jgi:hypothetical protein